MTGAFVLAAEGGVGEISGDARSDIQVEWWRLWRVVRGIREEGEGSSHVFIWI